MAKALIDYDKELPEIADRREWERPASYLVKDAEAPTGWREETSGRRPSQLLLVPKIRTAVDRWRDDGYRGASAVTRRLFEYWFEEDHEIAGFPSPFRYYFCQREAIETLAWLVEIAGKRDAKDLIEAFATIFKTDLLTKNIEFESPTEGPRQVRRYVPEREGVGVQDLPPLGLERYAFKMATGSGKTWVMAMAIVWSHFHRKMIAGSPLSTNFLIISPNVIVHQRLEKDFASNAIFHALPLVPPEWGKFSSKVILRGEATEPDPSGNIFIANIQQLYESRDEEWTPINAVDALLGRKPAKHAAAAGQRSMLERLKSLEDLVVMNDEAHHVHEESLEWTKSLLGIHRALPKGLSLWLDFSATPKDQNGMYFPWTVVDYPLAQAVEDRIVKAPLIVTNSADPKQPKHDPDNITADNIGDKYGYWLRAAVERWKEHNKVLKRLGVKPVLFIVAEKNLHADALRAYFVKTKELGFKEPEILVIHTDTTGEVSKKDLDIAREAARDIDRPDNRIKVLISVMMLREGWDVKNVTVVLGLRPFTAKAEILPEQVIGRGLRLLTDVGPDRTQTLEVLGTQNLLDVLRTQLEAEGVGVGSTSKEPALPVVVTPLQERLAYDIAIPLTKPSLVHEIRRLSELDVAALEPITNQEELAEPFRIRLKLEFITTQTEVHQADIGTDIPPAHELIASITNKVIDRAKLPNRFAELYPVVRDYARTRCFDCCVDLEEEHCRSHLSRLEIQDAIAKYLARKIAELTLDRRVIEFENAAFRLSETRPFQWRRDLPPLVAKHTVFNFVATYNKFEREFAKFLDRASDVVRFASLGTTDQGRSGSQFRVDYLKPSGAIGFYHPDWVAIQKTAEGDVNWIIETKGRVWEGTEAKDAAMTEWCRRVSAATDSIWRFDRVNQTEFASTFKTLGDLLAHIRSVRPLWRSIANLSSSLADDTIRLPRDLAANVDLYLYGGNGEDK